MEQAAFLKEEEKLAVVRGWSDLGSVRDLLVLVLVLLLVLLVLLLTSLASSFRYVTG